MNINEKNYDNLSDAVAFVVHFAFMVYTYGDIDMEQFETKLCSQCGHLIRDKVFLAPKTSCKKECGVLHNFEYGVSEQIRNELLSEFDIKKEDFREVCNKKGEIVYWQITPRHIMMPLSKSNRIKSQKACPKCGFVQYRMDEFENEKGEPYYYITKEALEDMQDINRTFETFECFIPMYVVSRRVYDYLSSKYPRMKFAPMYLKE